MDQKSHRHTVHHARPVPRLDRRIVAALFSRRERPKITLPKLPWEEREANMEKPRSEERGLESSEVGERIQDELFQDPERM